MKAFQELGKKISDQPRESDQRSQKRIPTRYYACLHAASGVVLSDCLVKDISETGACIILPRAASLPKQVLLRITGEATPMSAFVVWQTGTKCGLEFDDAACV
jgi:hypothetical protein